MNGEDTGRMTTVRKEGGGSRQVKFGQCGSGRSGETWADERRAVLKKKMIDARWCELKTRWEEMGMETKSICGYGRR